MKAAAALVLIVLALALAPTAAQAQLNGSIYQAEGSAMSLMFTVSGQTFVTAILSFGGGGNGRWFAAAGTTNGTTGTGQVIVPAGFTVTIAPGSSFSFQLDQSGGPTGSFDIVGLEDLIPVSSGRLVRVFP